MGSQRCCSLSVAQSCCLSDRKLACPLSSPAHDSAPGRGPSPLAGGPSGKPGQAGPPIFLSRPHYCDADPALAAGVHGLACQPELHESHLDVGEWKGRAVNMHMCLLGPPLQPAAGVIGSTCAEPIVSSLVSTCKPS